MLLICNIEEKTWYIVQIVIQCFCITFVGISTHLNIPMKKNLFSFSLFMLILLSVQTSTGVNIIRQSDGKTVKVLNK